MTTPRLECTRFPYVPIQLRMRGLTVEFDALLDTGFDGDVVVPTSAVVSAGTPDGHWGWSLADGSSVLTAYYLGSVAIGALGSFMCLVTVLGDEPLVGRSLSDHFVVTLDHGQRLVLEP